MATTVHHLYGWKIDEILLVRSRSVNLLRHQLSRGIGRMACSVASDCSAVALLGLGPLQPVENVQDTVVHEIAIYVGGCCVDRPIVRLCYFQPDRCLLAGENGGPQYNITATGTLWATLCCAIGQCIYEVCTRCCVRNIKRYRNRSNRMSLPSAPSQVCT